MNIMKAAKAFNDNLNLWKTWEMTNDRITWVDAKGVKHVAKSIRELNEQLKQSAS